MTNWQPIDSAPKDGTRFLALNYDLEMWVCRIVDGQMQYRTNCAYEPTKHTRVVIEGRELWAIDHEYAKANRRWWSHWTLWTALYEFRPTDWMPLPAPPEETTND